MAEPISLPDAADWHDEDGALRPGFVAHVLWLIAAGDGAALTDLLGPAHEADLGALLSLIEPEPRLALARLLGPAFDFAALTEVDANVRAEMLAHLPRDMVAAGLAALESDDAVYLLEDLDGAARAEVLARMPAEARATLRRALGYPEDSVGRRMSDAYIAVPPGWTVGHVIDHLRETDDLPEDFAAIFVVAEDGRLLGQVRLDRLLRAKRPVPIMALLEENPHTLAVDWDLHEARREFERYDLLSSPVVDELGRLVGVLTIDDIVDIIEDEADAEIKALGGVKSDEELTDGIWSIATGRFTWLLVNLVTAFIASAVLKAFEAQLDTMVALAVLAPIVASQGGNAATQTMTVAVRALATAELGPHNAVRLILREVIAGFLNGIAFALITGVIAGLWFSALDLGIVIGLAMVCNLVAGVLGGILIPMALDRLGADPAVASGPFVTTVTDVVGFLAFLGIASWWFAI